MRKLQRAAEATVRIASPLARNDNVETSAPAGRRQGWREALSSRRLLIGVGLALALAVAAGVIAARPPLVDTAPATLGEAVEVVYATGVVDFVRQARIAPVVAAPIRQALASEGERVEAGALLAQLEDGPQRATLAQLEAQASLARLAADRARRLHERGFISEAAWDEARGQREAAEAAAASARALLAHYAVTAPFAGTVLRRDAEPGDLASPSQVLFVLADEASLRITADLDERDVARVAVGQSVIIRADAFPGEAFDATVSQITPQGEAATRVFRVRFGLDPDTPLRAGMTVEANIVAARRMDAVLVPAAAVEGDAVWVAAEGRAERRAVVRGATGAERVEIRQGVRAGEAVILDPSDALRDGRRIRAREAPP